MRRQGGHSPSSSIDSSSHPSLSSASSGHQKSDLSTDLRLGLIMSTAAVDSSVDVVAREFPSDWPAGRSVRRLNTVGAAAGGRARRPAAATFFVKVYMEGIPIGRKLDLLALDGYDALLRTLRRMFKVSLSCKEIQGPDPAQRSSPKTNILTYEDTEGDWMMVGDVPWEMFVTSVRRLKIMTRAG